MAKRRVIVLDNIAQEGLEALEAVPEFEVVVQTGLAGNELKAALAEADAAICRSGVKITADVLEGNTRLKAIARAGVGVDNIDLDAATRQGIVVMNTPGGNTLATAELTMALMLAVSRRIPEAWQSLNEGRWDRKKFMGTQLEGKTLGIVGLGRIGQAVARRAVGFGMKVIGYDPLISQDRARELHVTLVDQIDELLPQVDYLTVHTPLNDQTRHLINRDRVALLKPGVRLINCARGGIFDEEAIVEGLKSGKIAGVAVDVYENEPCTDSPLFGMPNVVCTPHLGASSREAQKAVALEAVKLITDFLLNGTIRQSVNVSPIDAQTLADLGPDMNLAYRLGLVLAQMHDGAPEACKLVYQGDVAGRDTRLLSAAFAAGLLEAAMDLSVSIVNAEVFLKERGIRVYEERTPERGDFGSAIRADVSGASDTKAVCGSVIGQNQPRIVGMGPCPLVAPLEGILLFFVHRDMPGVIGRVGNLFARYGINIGHMSVGRSTNEPGHEAIGVLVLDAVPSDAALDEFRAMDAIGDNWLVKLPPLNELPVWMR
ncbi:MAG: phosphoglycerate dehydrogenase [Planctomycetota bacterium]|nr:MAG: phosphoglycerate dehydrogenase [Planctomycetota bacterium]